MRISLYFPSFVFLTGASFGQTENKESPLEGAPVLDEVVYKQGKDTLVIQRIEQPEPLRTEEGDKSAAKESKGQVKVTLPVQTYVISATSFGKEATRLKIWPSQSGMQGAMEGWSNIDWSILQSLLSFEGEQKRYQFMLFYSGSGQGSDLPEVPVDLPKFTQTGARYLVTSSNEAEREDTLDFLESIHALYDENRHQLKNERNLAIKKQEERKRQIEKEAQKPKTRVLKIWRHTRSEDEQVSE